MIAAVVGGIGRGLASFALAALALGVVVLGCDGRDASGVGRYPAHGIVEDVDREYAQVLIEHDAVEGLMPAMTMNFSVPDADVLARLAPGQVIDFELDFTGRSYEVVDFEIVGEGAFEAGWRRLGAGLVRTSPVPGFELIDQAGQKVAFASFGDRVLLIDFIYTRCPGPCPVQTARQVALQRRIPESLRARVQFLSLSLDPDHDQPEELARYASRHGADLSNWSFLTGPVEKIAVLTRAYGVGSLRKPDGTIDHTLVTFLVHDGRLLDRYLPRPGEEDRLLADIVALASERTSSPASPSTSAPDSFPGSAQAEGPAPAASP